METTSSNRHFSLGNRRSHLYFGLVARCFCVFLLYLPSCTSDSIVIPDSPVAAEERIIFTSNASGSFQLYSMDTAGTGIRQLTVDSSFGLSEAAYSPDMQKIAVVHSEGEGPFARPVLYTMNADGSSRLRLTRTSDADYATGSGYNPRWSADGRWIAFTRQVGPEVAGWDQTFIIQPTGGNGRRISSEDHRI